tara:strand:- start:19917 stop:20198 length:282 start_codon:yes stop_codon:yes gene_type:complete
MSTDNVTDITAYRNHLETRDLRQLFDLAKTYGVFWLYEMSREENKPPGFYCKIEFETEAGISLEAKSDYRAPSEEEALIQAINRAKKISSQFK